MQHRRLRTLVWASAALAVRLRVRESRAACSLLVVVGLVLQLAARMMARRMGLAQTVLAPQWVRSLEDEPRGVRPMLAMALAAPLPVLGRCCLALRLHWRRSLQSLRAKLA